MNKTAKMSQGTHGGLHASRLKCHRIYGYVGTHGGILALAIGRVGSQVLWCSGISVTTTRGSSHTPQEPTLAMNRTNLDKGHITIDAVRVGKPTKGVKDNLMWTNLQAGVILCFLCPRNTFLARPGPC